MLQILSLKKDTCVGDLQRSAMIRGSGFLRSKKHQFDVCVIGAGPAGIAAAMRALDYHRSVCLVEAHPTRLGGSDLWDGALHSKTMWEMSKTYRRIKGKTAKRFMSVLGDETRLVPSFPRLVESMEAAAVQRQSQVEAQLAMANVPILRGAGALVDKHTLQVMGKCITADYFVVATGCSPRSHPTIPFDGKVVLSSADLLNLREFPKSIVIIGAGVIGCEFASILANFGQTRVHVIEKSSRILPVEDADVSGFVQRLLENKGVDFHHHSSLVTGAARDGANGGSFVYSLRNTKTGEETQHTVERALVSIGRAPVLNTLGLSNIGVDVSSGRLEVDRFCRVAGSKNIYAVGDLSTKMQLVNVAEREGRMAVDHMYGVDDEESYVLGSTISSIMFLDQELAAVGLNEQQCQSRNISYRVASYSYRYVSRAVAMGNTRGFAKLLVTNDDKMHVLGLRAVGAHASSIVDLGSLAMANKTAASQLGHLLTAYPSVTQGFLECVRILLGTSTLKPNRSPGISHRTWTPPKFDRGRAFQED
jgi:dihydrolipoamide dehydrogenase